LEFDWDSARFAIIDHENQEGKGSPPRLRGLGVLCSRKLPEGTTIGLLDGQERGCQVSKNLVGLLGRDESFSGVDL
jgi:hypothetical protein